MKDTLVFLLRHRRRSIVAAIALACCLATPLVTTAAIAAARTSPDHTATAARFEASRYASAPLRGLSAELVRQIGRTRNVRWLYAARSLDSLTRRVPTSAPGGRTSEWRYRRRSDPAIPVGNAPQATALDPATHTLYEANGNDNTLSVINSATCNAIITISCGQTPPTVQTGSGPVSLAVDHNTDTIYVANAGDNTVSVINGATCNAQNTSGCGLTAPAVTVGSVPVALDVNQATDTVYVADWGNGTGTTVSVINGATCNGQDTAGCGQVPASVTIGAGPAGVIVDQSTDTVYVATVAADNSEAVYVINGGICNGTVTAGCGQAAPSVTVGAGSSDYNVGFAIDQSAKTLYVTNWSANTLSMIDKATCNAADSAGCSQMPAVVHVGSGPTGIALDAATHTVYTSNINDDTVSAINATTCNALIAAGCSTQPSGSLRTGAGPGWVTMGQATDTIYTPNGDDNTVSVLNGATCNATVTADCSRFLPTAPVGNAPDGVAVNDSTHTVYVANYADGTVSVINGATCNASVTSGCKNSIATVTVGSGPGYLTVDQATDTIYVPNINDNTVSVIDGKTCNATVTSGCTLTPPTIAVAGYPAQAGVDEATDTVYVGTFSGNLAVINGKTCNSTVVSGCGQTPATVAVSNYIGDIAVNQDTNTVYIANPADDTVSAVDGWTCNATVTIGCGQTPATVQEPSPGTALDVDLHTNTVYVLNTFTNSVSMINGTTCDATVTSGCSQTLPTVAVGSAPYDVAVDQASDAVYVINLYGASTSVINGKSCNATVTFGCSGPQPAIPVGGQPQAVDVSSATNTVYVANNADNNVSVFGPNFALR